MRALRSARNSDGKRSGRQALRIFGTGTSRASANQVPSLETTAPIQRRKAPWCAKVRHALGSLRRVFRSNHSSSSDVVATTLERNHFTGSGSSPSAHR